MKATFHYPDLGGGINKGISPEILPSREMPHLIDFYPYGTHLKRRGGHKRVGNFTNLDANSFISRGNPSEPSSTYFDLYMGGATSFNKLIGSSGFLVPIPFASGTAAPLTSAQPWTLLQYQGIVYAIRGHNNTVNMWAIDDDVAYDSGIPTPGGAATIADGGAGALTAANYQTVYTFYDTTTGFEGNPSPVSNTLALAGGRQIAWTNIGVSVNPRINARRLYRTLPDQEDVYYLVGTIFDNATTTFTDNVEVQNLGDPVSFDNGAIPIQRDGFYLVTGDIWRERLWATDGVDLIYSEFQSPETWGAESVIPIHPDDTHRVRVVRASQDRLYAGKTNGIFYITGSGPSTFELNTLTDRHGVVSASTFHAIENNLYWLAPDRAIYTSDGVAEPTKISDPWVTSLLETITDAGLEQVTSGVDTARGWITYSVPGGFGVSGDGTAYAILVYNYRERVWTTFSFEGGSVGSIGAFFDTAKKPILVGVNAGRLYRLADESQNYDDNPNLGELAISPALLLKSDDFGLPGLRKMIKKVSLLFDYTRLPNPTTTEDRIVMRIYGEGSYPSSPLVTRALFMDDGGNGWRTFTFGILERPQTRLQLHIQFNSTHPLVLREIMFELAVSARMSGQPR